MLWPFVFMAIKHSTIDLVAAPVLGLACYFFSHATDNERANRQPGVGVSDQVAAVSPFGNVAQPIAFDLRKAIFEKLSLDRPTSADLKELRVLAHHYANQDLSECISVLSGRLYLLPISDLHLYLKGKTPKEVMQMNIDNPVYLEEALRQAFKQSAPEDALLVLGALPSYLQDSLGRVLIDELISGPKRTGLSVIFSDVERPGLPPAFIEQYTIELLRKYPRETSQELAANPDYFMGLSSVLEGVVLNSMIGNHQIPEGETLKTIYSILDENRRDNALREFYAYKILKPGRLESELANVPASIRNAVIEAALEKTDSPALQERLRRQIQIPVNLKQSNLQPN